MAILPNVTMSQSSVIGASLVGGFVLYLMLKGKLGNYWSILMGGSNQSASAGAGGGTVPGSPVGTVLGVPGVTTLSPGATGIVIDPTTGRETMNPGPTFNPFGPGGIFGPPAGSSSGSSVNAPPAASTGLKGKGQ